MGKGIEVHPVVDEEEKKFKKKIERARVEEQARLEGEGDPNAHLMGYIVGQDIKMEELEKVAWTDELTGLMSRRIFDPTIKRFMEMIVRNHRENSVRGESFGYTKLSLLFLDINKFKFLNDTYGHSFGDKVLKKVANTLKDTLRGNDLICRWGGDEFAICLLGVGKEGVKKVMRKIEIAMGEAFVEEFGKDYLGGRSPVSIGVSFFGGIVEKSIDDEFLKLMKEADKNMYADKGSTKLETGG